MINRTLQAKAAWLKLSALTKSTITIGMVFISFETAKVAPVSDKLLKKAMIEPAIIAGFISGNKMLIKHRFGASSKRARSFLQRMRNIFKSNYKWLQQQRKCETQMSQ